jgi:hypothetical protein
MKPQRHRQRRNNTALARNPHLFHFQYGCSPTGKNYDHARDCGQSRRDSKRWNRAIEKTQKAFGVKTRSGLITRFLKKFSSKVAK